MGADEDHRSTVAVPRPLRRSLTTTAPTKEPTLQPAVHLHDTLINFQTIAHLAAFRHNILNSITLNNSKFPK